MAAMAPHACQDACRPPFRGSQNSAQVGVRRDDEWRTRRFLSAGNPFAIERSPLERSHVAAPRPGKQRQGEAEPFRCSDWPVPFELLQLGIRPSTMALELGAELDAVCWVVLDPFEI